LELGKADSMARKSLKAMDVRVKALYRYNKNPPQQARFRENRVRLNSCKDRLTGENKDLIQGLDPRSQKPSKGRGLLG